MNTDPPFFHLEKDKLMRLKFLFLSILLSLSGACHRAGLEGLVPVGGTVLFNAEPLAEAIVILHPREDPDPASQRRPAMGTTNARGLFEAWTLHPGDGVFPGEYDITVAKSIVTNPMTREEIDAYVRSHGGMMPEIETKSVIPLKYADKTTSGFTTTIPVGGTKGLKLELADER